MGENFAEFFVLGLIMLAIVCAVVYGPMVIVGALMYFAGLK